MSEAEIKKKHQEESARWSETKSKPKKKKKRAAAVKLSVREAADVRQTAVISKQHRSRFDV